MLVTRGKITSFDTTNSTLIVSTSHGSEQFVLTSPWPRVEEGRRTLSVEQLATLSGHDVQIRCTQAGGAKTVASIHVENAPKSAKVAK